MNLLQYVDDLLLAVEDRRIEKLSQMLKVLSSEREFPSTGAQLFQVDISKEENFWTGANQRVTCTPYAHNNRFVIFFLFFLFFCL